MAKKIVSFNRSGIETLPDNKPVVYTILTEGGRINYVGVAQKGRIQERLLEHLSSSKDHIPGNKVQIEQMNSIEEAKAKESQIISRIQPTYNKKGK